MTENLLIDGKVYKQYLWDSEEEFEKEVIIHSRELFGDESIYIDIKKRIGKGDILSIPDGYLIDFSFKNDARVYIIENELSTHDPFAHIGQQLLKFSISYKASGRKIKEFLLNNIEDFDLPLILFHSINTFLPNSAILEVFQNPL